MERIQEVVEESTGSPVGKRAPFVLATASLVEGVVEAEEEAKQATQMESPGKSFIVLFPQND